MKKEPKVAFLYNDINSSNRILWLHLLHRCTISKYFFQLPTSSYITPWRKILSEFTKNNNAGGPYEFQKNLTFFISFFMKKNLFCIFHSQTFRYFLKPDKREERSQDGSLKIAFIQKMRLLLHKPVKFSRYFLLNLTTLFLHDDNLAKNLWEIMASDSDTEIVGII